MRFFRKLGTKIHSGRQQIRPEASWVIVVTHEATRTGAPIVVYNLAAELSRYFNVAVLSLRPGPLIEAFRDVSAEVYFPSRLLPKPLRVKSAVRAVTGRRRFRFAVLNSVETHQGAEPFARRGIKIVTLAHEFAAYLGRRKRLEEMYRLSDAIVFSSALTRDDSERLIGFPPSARIALLPQGKCAIPGKTSVEESGPARDLEAVLRQPGTEAQFLVLGVGSLEYRKGVDLFVAIAARVRSAAPEIPFRFVWIGGHLNATKTGDYRLYILDQIDRMGVEDMVSVIPATAELETAYRLANVLLLPSRLDPLPNVAIDALSAGLPVLSFDRATGVAELLDSAGLAAHCVAPYLDVGAMAEQLVALARSPEMCQSLGKASAELARQRLDFHRYAETLVRLAESIEDKDTADIRPASEIFKT